MGLADFAVLMTLAMLAVTRLAVIHSIVERIAVSLAFVFALKSFEIFILIFFGLRPEIYLQLIFSVLLLSCLVVFCRKVPGPMKPVEGVRENFPWSCEILATVAILSLLIALSFCNSYFFPITQTDGIWYHVKAMVYFSEGDVRSDFNHLQHRFYSPFVPLLYTWLISLDWEKLKIIFPAFYACLLIIFYFRLRESSGNAKLSATFTLLLGTTPYFWWHSVQSVLNLAAGVYYSLGGLFWYFLITQTKEGSSDRAFSFALISGMFFGISAWARLEFILYVAIPFLLLVFCLDRNTNLPPVAKRRVVWGFALCALIPASLWFVTLWSMIGSDEKTILGLMAACALFWTLIPVYLKGWTQLGNRMLIGMGIVLVAGFFGLFFLFGPMNLSPGTALMVGLFRTFAFQIFYSFTVLLIIFLFAGRLWELSSPQKYMGVLLIFYCCGHFVLYSYFHPEWNSFAQYLSAIWPHPGNGVNTADTREMLAFYPVLIFFISFLPKIRQAFR
jgi:hypothetical protein